MWTIQMESLYGKPCISQLWNHIRHGTWSAIILQNEPDAEIQLKSMLTKLLTHDSKIIGSILTKYILL